MRAETFRVAHLSLQDLSGLVGQTLGVSSWLRIEQNRITAFAEATLDRQWIHVDETRAAAGPFGATVAHGYLTLSLLSHFTNTLELFEELTVLNYGLDRARFISPVRVGNRLRDHVRLLNTLQRQDGLLITLEHSVEIEAEAKPALVAETLALVII